MRDDDGFLGRWARRKAEAREAEPPPEPEPETVAAPDPVDDTEAFDPESLPPIESLGEGSDYTVFLRKAVPPALKVAALRQAWRTAPAIMAHKPMVDYDWDVNAPGYGKLWPQDDPAAIVKDLFRRCFAEAPEAEEEEEPAEPAISDQNPGPVAEPEEEPPHVAEGVAEVRDPAPPRRGRATPA